MLRREPLSFFCFGEFRRGRRRFDDKYQSCSSATAVTVTNIEAVEKLIRAKARDAAREIQECLKHRNAVTMSITMTFLSENDVHGETTAEFMLRTFQRRPLKFHLGSAADR